MKLFSALVMTLLALGATTSTAQVTPFCNAGIRPDGFVDFSLLPPAPDSPASAPFTATLPVVGVGGLTVTLTIPAGTGNAPGPLYVVQGGTLFVLAGSPMLTLAFSAKVAGVGLVASSLGRGESFTLGNPPSDAQVPGLFSNSVESYVLAPTNFSTPLQQVEPGAGFTTTSVSGTAGGAYVSPAVAGISNLRVQSAAANAAAAVPTEGLEQWLRSEAVEGQLAGSATVWPDQSGNGHDATAPTGPGQSGPVQIQQDGNNCRGAFAFGNNSYFDFNLPISGWAQMTIFLVGRSVQDPPADFYASMASAIMWNESAPWGNTFLSPYQQGVPFRFGTGQVGNQPVYARPTTIGQDFTVTRAVHDGTTDSLYVDGIHVFSEPNKVPALSGTTGSGYIGRGINDTYFQGEIGEILVYDRVLSGDETAVVEKYLRNKFGTN